MDFFIDLYDLGQSILAFDWTWGGLADIGLNVVGLIPGVGDLAKGSRLGKNAIKTVDAVADVTDGLNDARKAIKRTDALVDASKAAKNINKGSDAVDTANDASKALKSADKNVLYHYTNEKGMNGIIETKQLNPSLKANNPNHARHGNGQYLSDIPPGTKAPIQLAGKFIRRPNKYKFTHYIEIDVSNLDVIDKSNGIFLISNENPLDLTGRIISWEKTKKGE